MTNDTVFFFEKEHENFLKSNLYQKLKKDYKHLFLDYYHDNLVYDIDYKIEQKYHRYSRFSRSIFHYSIFIYLNSIITESHEKIADIGCGYNFIKKYFPKTVGYDKTEFADYKELFDDSFIINHYEEFDVAVAICSLHFISMRDFTKRINDFGKIIKSGGYGFITFNTQRMIEHTDKDFLQNFSNLKNFYDYFNNEIKKIDYKIVAYDNLILHNQKIKNNKKYEKYKELHGVDWPSFNDIINNKYTCINHTISEEVEFFKKQHDIINHAVNELNDGLSGVIRIIFKKQ